MKTRFLTCAAAFLGSALLFCVQPMLGRTLQPLFGGSAAVWGICLAAYQTLLLAGYLYAHALALRTQSAAPLRLPRLGRGKGMHIVLLGVAALWVALFAMSHGVLKNVAGNGWSPALQVLVCVVIGIGLPYILLSAGATLLQVWLAAEADSSGQSGSRGVYRLYAVSNLGSFAGLLTYPFLLEPFVALQAQWLGLGLCLAAYVALLARATRLPAKPADPTDPTDLTDVSPAYPSLPPLPPALEHPLLWYLLPALATFVLNAVTAYLSADVMPMPLLWVALLGVFLLSYVAGFSRPGEVALPVWCALCSLSAAFLLYAYWKGSSTAFLLNMGAGSAFIFCAGLFLTGWLYRIRPEERRLSHFYLGVATGGAVGGVTASLLCPHVFNHVAELPLALLALVALCAIFLKVLDHKELRGGLNTALILLCVCVFLTSATVWQRKCARVAGSWRNFYSVTLAQVDPVRRQKTNEIVGRQHSMFHGGTVHGTQVFYQDFARQPTTYFSAVGGGAAICNHPRYLAGQPLRVGVLGLGIGTLAAWGRPGDTYRFYEINPQVIALAHDTNLFTYVSDCCAALEIVAGDARKMLEAERAAGLEPYDVLLLDAFSGDNLPIHLISLEAFELYLDMLKPDGILAVNSTNWHLDLLPLCQTAAQHFGLHATGIAARADPARFTCDSLWSLLTRHAPVEPDLSSAAPGTAVLVDWQKVCAMRRPITDDFGSTIGLIKFGMTPPIAARAEVRVKSEE